MHNNKTYNLQRKFNQHARDAQSDFHHRRLTTYKKQQLKPTDSHIMLHAFIFVIFFLLHMLRGFNEGFFCFCQENSYIMMAIVREKFNMSIEKINNLQQGFGFGLEWSSSNDLWHDVACEGISSLLVDGGSADDILDGVEKFGGTALSELKGGTAVFVSCGEMSKMKKMYVWMMIISMFMRSTLLLVAKISSATVLIALHVRHRWENIKLACTSWKRWTISIIQELYTERRIISDVSYHYCISFFASYQILSPQILTKLILQTVVQFIHPIPYVRRRGCRSLRCNKLNSVSWLFCLVVLASSVAMVGGQTVSQFSYTCIILDL